MKSWNNLPIEFRTCTSVSKFKSMIISLIRPQKRSIFGIYHPVGIKKIFQLRVGLSALKCHKKAHNFLDTPSDWCTCLASPEDTSHFLLHCSSYSQIRSKLFDTVRSILNKYNLTDLLNDSQVLLYGHSQVAQNDNRSIILATADFVMETKRLPL